MSIPFRLVRASLLIGFALLIAKLFATGEMVKYMSPALDPLTAVTALVLAGMGAVELRGVHDKQLDHSSDMTEQAVTSLLLLLPLLLGFFFVPRALGYSALGGESVANLLLSFGTGPSSLVHSAPPAPPAPVEDVGDLMSYLRQAGEASVGQRVRVSGPVAHSQALAQDEFALLRFSIAHCVADARPIGLLIVAPGQVSWTTDQWVRVEGVLASREHNGERLVSVIAEAITPIEEPTNPYLQAT
jgi:putative membrane protein